MRQNTNTYDLLLSFSKTIAFISQNTTLEVGTVIMTGTPGGIGAGMKPPKYLNDGDVVEVEIEKIGTLSNRMDFE